MYHLTCTSSRGTDTAAAATIGGITGQLADQLARHLPSREPVRWTITTPAGADYPGSITSPSGETPGSLIDNVYDMLAHAAAKTADQDAEKGPGA